jgi:pyridoxamine 5'-phosphate oxidase
MTTVDIAALRREYARDALTEGSVDPDPVAQFRLWFDQALQSEVLDANAMTLATAGRDSRPSTRIVLLKEIDERGFVFFTNYLSEKGHDLKENPYASLLFYWAELERQVRIDGPVEKVSVEESEIYFATRPRGSRLGAHASPQSSVIESADELERRIEELDSRFGEDIPRPEHWGGYRVRPELIEFWQGRLSRLHDRLRYTREGESWKLQRIAP